MSDLVQLVTENLIQTLIFVLVVFALGGGAFIATRSRGQDEELIDDTGDVDISSRIGDVVGDIVSGSDVTVADEAEAQEATDAAREEAVEARADEQAVELEEIIQPSFFERLGKARSAFTGYLGSLVGASKLSDDDWEALEDALIQADVGVSVAMKLIEDVKAEAAKSDADDGAGVLELLKARMHRELEDKQRDLCIAEEMTNVWLFVGVNGVGKTTTIGKVGRRLVDEGHRPLMAAGDTFRAAAAEQLTMWGERAGVEVVRGSEGGDPASVIFDGVAAAAARGCDVVLADTAGRLHNKSNLMAELGKVRRVADRDPGHVSEVLLVLDATTGQNGMAQAKVFTEAVNVTGIVLTKLDGSARGGIVFAVESELGIPVKLVGLGEKVGDLVDFDPVAFVDALFD